MSKTRFTRSFGPMVAASVGLLLVALGTSRAADVRNHRGRARIGGAGARVGRRGRRGVGDGRRGGCGRRAPHPGHDHRERDAADEDRGGHGERAGGGWRRRWCRRGAT